MPPLAVARVRARREGAACCERCVRVPRAEIGEVGSAAGTCLGRLSAHCGGSERLYGLVGIGG